MTKTDEGIVVHEPWPFELCPECDGTDFLVRDVDGIAVFTCLGCAASWRYWLGYLVPIRLPEPEPASDEPEPASDEPPAESASRLDRV